MELASREEEGVTVVTVRGDINAATSDRLEREIAGRIAAGQRRLVLDLGDVRYVSSAGLRVFLIATRQTVGGAFVLARLAPAVQGVVEMAGFLAVLTVKPDVAAAIAAAKPA